MTRRPLVFYPLKQLLLGKILKMPLPQGSFEPRVSTRRRRKKARFLEKPGLRKDFACICFWRAYFSTFAVAWNSTTPSSFRSVTTLNLRLRSPSWVGLNVTVSTCTSLLSAVLSRTASWSSVP